MKYRKITNQKSTVVHNNGQHRFMPTLKKRKKTNKYKRTNKTPKTWLKCVNIYHGRTFQSNDFLKSHRHRNNHVPLSEIDTYMFHSFASKKMFHDDKDINNYKEI